MTKLGALWSSTAPRAFIDFEDQIVAAEGVRVCDRRGRWLLDARSGYWNVTLGYSQKAIVDAIAQQAAQLPYAHTWGYGRPNGDAESAARKLVDRLPGNLSHVRFHANGSQAVESAALLSRYLRLQSGRSEKMTIVGLWGGFHGFGGVATHLTGLPYLHYHAGPLVPDIRHIQLTGFADIGVALAELERFGPERISAIVFEPIIGEGGYVFDVNELTVLRAFCDEFDIHLIADEVTTGAGRSGLFTRTQVVDVRVDMMTLGKGITSGYMPLSAVAVDSLLFEQVADAPVECFFATGSTHDGHPLSLAAMNAVLDLLTDDLLARVNLLGDRLENALRCIADRSELVCSVRGAGMMYAVELVAGDNPLMLNIVRLAMEEQGVLAASLKTLPALMFIPPIVMNDDEIDQVSEAFDAALDMVQSGWRPEQPLRGIV